ncbi:MAG: hypothetical protein Q9219_006394 [cf. Caloplaca sp. 3 TL-2023]
MGRDLDSQWVHLLAHNRRNQPGSASPSSDAGGNRHVRSRSSATNYFTLLSASEDGSNAGRPYTNHRRQGNSPGITARDMDSSWVAWFTERWHQRQLADTPDSTLEEAHTSNPSFHAFSNTLSPSETQQLQMQNISLPQNLENTFTSHTAPTTASAVPSSVATSPWPSPSNDMGDSDIDSLDAFNELLTGFCSALPFDPSNQPANDYADTCRPAGINERDFTWLEEQHAFPFDMSDESAISSPASKRSRDEYTGDYTVEGQTHLENITNKKRKVSHPWANHPEISSPFSSCMIQSTPESIS